MAQAYKLVEIVAHAGVQFKEVLEVVMQSVTVSEALFFGNVSTERIR